MNGLRGMKSATRRFRQRQAVKLFRNPERAEGGPAQLSVHEVHEDEDDADATAHNHALAAEIQGYLSQGKLHGRSVGHCEPRFQAPGSYEFLGRLFCHGSWCLRLPKPEAADCEPSPNINQSAYSNFRMRRRPQPSKG